MRQVFAFALVVWRVPLFFGHDATFVTDRSLVTGLLTRFFLAES